MIYMLRIYDTNGSEPSCEVHGPFHNLLDAQSAFEILKMPEYPYAEIARGKDVGERVLFSTWSRYCGYWKPWP